MPDYLWAQALSDEEWCEFLAGAAKDGHVPPPLPPEEFQRSLTGDVGMDVMRDGVAFCRLPRRQKRRVCRVHDAAALGLADARVFQRMGG